MFIRDRSVFYFSEENEDILTSALNLPKPGLLFLF